MKAVNLYFLTRIRDPEAVSLLLRSAGERTDGRSVSFHEAASLWTLIDRLRPYLQNASSPVTDEWIAKMDGFYFSYVIRHIGKEFDLLKMSADGRHVLNIELKSEQVDEDRIKKQLEQNRYYLSHIARVIWSFTYVMETDQLYTMNDRGILRLCSMEELAAVMKRDALKDCMPDGIDQYFRAADYLISPIASPEKFLQGKYFLTNQQFDFKRKILEILSSAKTGPIKPVISVSGVAGTGKTLLLLDLAMSLSKKHRVLFIHSGPLRLGHLVIDSRLKNVEILSGSTHLADAGTIDHDYLLIDEADHLADREFANLLQLARRSHIPVVLAYDPHELLLEAAQTPKPGDAVQKTIGLIGRESTLSLSFSGNIRINRPVYSFLRSMLNQKDHPGTPDYSCIDVLYANDEKEADELCSYFRNRGYEILSFSGSAENRSDSIVPEYEKVLIILNDQFFYDEELRLRVRNNEEAVIRMLYEGLSRTRERLCLLITGNPDLFMQLLSLRVSGGQIS